jgi:DNA-binding transcriptional regulator YiaG
METRSMTTADLKTARRKFGLSLRQWAHLLGYEGTDAQRMARHLEEGTRTIRPPQVRLVRAYLDGYRPADWPKEE